MKNNVNYLISLNVHIISLLDFLYRLNLTYTFSKFNIINSKHSQTYTHFEKMVISND